MTSATSTRPRQGDVDRPSAVRRALELTAGSVVVAVLLALALAALVDAPSEFLPLQPGPVAVATVVGVLLGLGTLALLRRLGRARIYTPLVLVGTLLSLGAPVDLLDATQAEQPGVSDDAAFALVPLHLLVGAIVAFVLPRRVR